MYIKFGLTRAAAKENPTSRGGLSSLDNQSAPLPEAMTMEPRGQLSNQMHKDPVWGRTGPVRLPAGWTLENKGNVSLNSAYSASALFFFSLEQPSPSGDYIYHKYI